MNMSELSGLVIVVVGAVLFVTAVQLYSFWAGEVFPASVKGRLDENVEGLRDLVRKPFWQRRKAA